MSQAAWAEGIARALLEEPLPRRWAHSQGVAAAARALAPVLGRHTNIVTAAAWLHDIGYAPAVHGCGDDLFREFKPAARGLSDALTYCDMTTGPQGQPLTAEQRFAEISDRYGPDHVVTRALARSAPELAASAARISRKLGGRALVPRPAQVPALMGAC